MSESSSRTKREVLETPVSELFPVETVEHGRDANEETLTEKQASVLDFILDNPQTAYADLVDACDITPGYAFTVVEEYAARSEDYEDLRASRRAVM